MWRGGSRGGQVQWLCVRRARGRAGVKRRDSGCRGRAPVSYFPATSDPLYNAPRPAVHKFDVRGAQRWGGHALQLAGGERA